MRTSVTHRAGSVTVGPPGGPHVKFPDHYTITITGEPPYDLVLDVTWDPALGRHTLHQLTITEQPGGDYVRMSRINQIALAEVIERCLVADVLGGPDGWQKLVADHLERDPVAVDALVYLLSHAARRTEPLGHDRHRPRSLPGKRAEAGCPRAPRRTDPAGTGTGQSFGVST